MEPVSNQTTVHYCNAQHVHIKLYKYGVWQSELLRQYNEIPEQILVAILLLNLILLE